MGVYGMMPDLEISLMSGFGLDLGFVAVDGIAVLDFSSSVSSSIRLECWPLFARDERRTDIV